MILVLCVFIRFYFPDATLKCGINCIRVFKAYYFYSCYLSRALFNFVYLWRSDAMHGRFDKDKIISSYTTQADKTAIKIWTNRPREITELCHLWRNLSIITSTLLGIVPSCQSRRSEGTSNRREIVLAELSALSPNLPPPLC